MCCSSLYNSVPLLAPALLPGMCAKAHRISGFTCVTQTTRGPSESCRASWVATPAPPASTGPPRLWKQPHYRMDTAAGRIPLPGPQRTDHRSRTTKPSNLTVYPLPLQKPHWECCLSLFNVPVKRRQPHPGVEDEEEGRSPGGSRTGLGEGTCLTSCRARSCDGVRETPSKRVLFPYFPTLAWAHSCLKCCISFHLCFSPA